jgi:hypothetical protein
MTSHSGTWRTTGTLAIGGGLAFWSANFAISLTPIAAEYRAALSIAYLPMLFEALVGGLVIGLVTGYSLIRLHHVFPDKSPVLTSVLLSVAALTTVTLLIAVPSTFLLPTEDALRYFLIAGLFNAIRIPALGVAMGYLYRKLVTTDRRERLQNGTYA